MMLVAEASRFWAKVDRNGPVPIAAPELGPCWLWTAATWGHGYGIFGRRSGTRVAHRIAYEEIAGPIADGLELDHLCRIRHCVNPSHLEQVTNRVNLLRGDGPTGTNARKTHCADGHLFDVGNTYRKPRNGTRQCIECARLRRQARAPHQPCLCGCGEIPASGVFRRGHNRRRAA